MPSVWRNSPDRTSDAFIPILLMVKQKEVKDIEDSEDRKHRFWRRRREVALLLDDDDDTAPLLFQRVQLVETRLRLGGKGGEGATRPQRGTPTQPAEPADEKPTLVLDDLVQQDSVAAIYGVVDTCRRLIDEYEQRQLHLLFESAEKNCSFRLYLYAIVYNYKRDVPHVFRDVLRQLCAQMNAQSTLNGQFGARKKVDPAPLATQRGDFPDLTLQQVQQLRKETRCAKDSILQVSAPLAVPAHIMRLFP